MQLPGSQSPDTVKQLQTIVTILHPTQVLMFYGVIDRKAITLQDFQQEKMGQGLHSNSNIPTWPKHMNRRHKKVFLFKVRHVKVFSGSESVFVANQCGLF